MTSKPLTLPAPARDALAAKFPGLDLATVRFVEGLPWFSRLAAVRAAAVTWAGTVHLAPGQFDPETADGLALLAHELVHIRQQRAEGLPLFALRYFGDYLVNLLLLLDSRAAYRAIRYEAEARDFAER